MLEGRAAGDHSLVDLAQAGSTEAFSMLFERYYPLVIGCAYRLTRDADEAQDVAQDAFTRAYLKLGDFRFDRPFAPWLFLTARNAAIDVVRKRRRTNAGLDAQAHAPAMLELGPEQMALREDTARHVRAALEELPGTYGEVLRLFYISDLHYRDIASRLGMPLGTVKTCIWRAKRRLRAALERAELTPAT